MEYSGSAIAIATAATPDANRKVVPRPASFPFVHAHDQISPFYVLESRNYTDQTKNLVLSLQKLSNTG